MTLIILSLNYIYFIIFNFQLISSIVEKLIIKSNIRIIIQI